MRWTPFAAALAALLSSCVGPLAASDPAGELPGDANCPPGSARHGPDEVVEPAPVRPDARFPWETADPPVADGFSGEEDIFVVPGDPSRGIPELDEPCLTPVVADDWLDTRSPVLAIEHRGQARAYPLAILHYHEIVNDVIAGEPVAVTYCPLCNSGLAFERRVGGDVFEFAVSDRIHRSNLVMYDRQSKNLWLQFTGEAIAGEPHVGSSLTRLPTSLVAWSQFREAHPDGWVLTRDTGYERDYGFNPYMGYGRSAFAEGFDPYDGVYPRGAGLAAKDRVLGLSGPPADPDPLAVPLEVLQRDRVVHAEVAGEEVVVLWVPGKADPLDAGTIADGRDVGQTGAFRPVTEVKGEITRLELGPADDEARFVDRRTGTSWNVLGHAVDGPLAGARLEPVARDDTMWFVWFSFHPDTRLIRP